jgi:biuret amidohydrolase
LTSRCATVACARTSSSGVALEVGIGPTVRHSADHGYIPIVVPDACGAGDAAAGDRALEALMLAGDAIVADADAVTHH